MEVESVRICFILNVPNGYYPSSVIIMPIYSFLDIRHQRHPRLTWQGLDIRSKPYKDTQARPPPLSPLPPLWVSEKYLLIDSTGLALEEASELILFQVIPVAVHIKENMERIVEQQCLSDSHRRDILCRWSPAAQGGQNHAWSAAAILCPRAGKWVARAS